MDHAITDGVPKRPNQFEHPARDGRSGIRRREEQKLTEGLQAEREFEALQMDCATRGKGWYEKAKPRISPERALIYEGPALLCTDRRFGF